MVSQELYGLSQPQNLPINDSDKTKEATQRMES